MRSGSLIKTGAIVMLTIIFSSFVPAMARASMSPATSSGVQALFDLGRSFEPFTAPFPSDRFTVADAAQNTGRRVSLPYPAADCAGLPVPTDPACFLIYTVNFQDGFNVQARLSIPFSGVVDPSSVNSSDVFLVSLGSTLMGGPKLGQVVGINQVVWEPATNTLHAESDAMLEQHTRYALIVTNGVHDVQGHPVQASEAFKNFPIALLQSKDPVLKAYGLELSLGLTAAIVAARISPASIVAASIFTTETVTSTLEKIRDQINARKPAPADFNIGPGGSRALFHLSDIAEVDFNLQFGSDPSDPNSFAINDTGLELWPVFFPGIAQVAYGRFTSPFYLTSDVALPQAGSLSGGPHPQSYNQVYFTLLLPAVPKPPHGWPVAIYGHGAGESKDFAITDVSGPLANDGIATLVINADGYGWGPASSVVLTKTDNSSVIIPAAGRSFDQNDDGIIGTGEGAVANGPYEPGDRDSRRQTVADWIQLVREIKAGMDVDGDGSADLDPSRIYFVGLSLGGIEGTVFSAIEPSVHSAVINSAGGAGVDFLRLSTVNQPLYVAALAEQVPSLLNGPGGTFIDNTPLRNQPPVVNTVPGAEAIQNFDDIAAWIDQPGDPVPFAQHLRKEPLPGVAAKSIIISFAKGDPAVPNPTETALVRAGDLADRVTYFRNDLFDLIDPATAQGGATGFYPHIFMVDFEEGPDGPATQVALGAQEQAGEFFASDGTLAVNPEVLNPLIPSGLFEVPIAGPLPEDLNFIF